MAQRAPYFHDGRFATLGELLEKTDGKMGNTGYLGKEDLKALEAYLGTLCNWGHCEHDENDAFSRPDVAAGALCRPSDSHQR